jgi:hypothetical protein
MQRTLHVDEQAQALYVSLRQRLQLPGIYRRFIAVAGHLQAFHCSCWAFTDVSLQLLGIYRRFIAVAGHLQTFHSPAVAGHLQLLHSLAPATPAPKLRPVPPACPCPCWLPAAEHGCSCSRV